MHWNSKHVYQQTGETIFPPDELPAPRSKLSTALI